MQAFEQCPQALVLRHCTGYLSDHFPLKVFSGALDFPEHNLEETLHPLQ